MSLYATAPQLTEEYITSVWETLPPFVRPTLLLPSPSLSAQLNCDLTIASETFQYTGSFKFRAAYNLLSSIPQKQVIAASSGNFGQAIAYASKLLGKRCVPRGRRPHAAGVDLSRSAVVRRSPFTVNPRALLM